MTAFLPYQRDRAVAYARRWALSRNPLFFDFTGRGGNCTSFVSQSLLAGCGVMNFTPTYGWFYRSVTDRAPAWSGVEPFYDFMIGKPEFAMANGRTGPFAVEATSSREIAPGDVIQLARADGDFYHTLIISGFSEDDVLVCAHSDDALDRPLSSYHYASLRVLHIEGARLEIDTESSYRALLEGQALPSEQAILTL